MTIDLEQLEALHAAATPGPWKARGFNPEYPSDGVPIIGLRLNEDGVPLHTPTNGIVAAGCLLPTEIDALDGARAKANAALIVAAVNAVPELIARLRSAEQERDELRRQKWQVQHVDTMNDMVAMGLARDAAEQRAQAAEARPNPSQFIGWIADRFQEKHVPPLARDQAISHAVAALDANHADAPFGHQDYSWDEDAAQGVADDEIEHWEIAR